MNIKLSLQTQVLLGFGLAVVILLTIGWISYVTTSRFLDTSREAIYRAGLIDPIKRVFALTYQAESDQRGYLFTAADFYLKRRQEALRELEETFEKLSGQARGHPGLKAEVNKLKRLAKARIELLDRVLARSRSSAEGARELLATGLGREQMDALQAEVKSVVTQQQQILRANANAAEHEGDRVLDIASVALAFAVAVLLMLMYFIHRALLARESAHAALARSETQLKTVVDRAVDAIIVINSTGRIESFNQSAERMFGYAANDALGCNVSMLMPSPYREQHDDYLKRYLRTGEKRIIGYGREVLGQRKSGEVFPIDLAVAESSAAGRRLFTGLLRDITERKRAETRQRQLVRELTAANEELKNFAYAVSHDLKAPLRAISSLSEWILTDYGDAFDEEGHEHMQLLRGRVKRMDALIDGILQYSRVGRVKERREPVDLNALLEEIIDLLGPPEAIKITVGEMPTITVERTRIQQLFQNLLSNAIKYMDKAEGRIHVACTPEDDGWRFSVADNGPGIAERHWGRIFLLFQTLASRDRTESTGVGLSLVKKIVELHGGRVWLESTLGEGTTFYFTLRGAEKHAG